MDLTAGIWRTPSLAVPNGAAAGGTGEVGEDVSGPGTSASGELLSRVSSAGLPNVPRWGALPQGSTLIDVDQAIAALFPQSPPLAGSTACRSPTWMPPHLSPMVGDTSSPTRSPSTGSGAESTSTSTKSGKGAPQGSKSKRCKGFKKDKGLRGVGSGEIAFSHTCSTGSGASSRTTKAAAPSNGKGKKGVAGTGAKIEEGDADGGDRKAVGGSSAVRKQWTQEEEEKFLKALAKLGPKGSETDPQTGRVSVRLGPGVSRVSFLVPVSRVHVREKGIVSFHMCPQ